MANLFGWMILLALVLAQRAAADVTIDGEGHPVVSQKRRYLGLAILVIASVWTLANLVGAVAAWNVR